MGTKPGTDSMFNELWQSHLKATDASDVKVSASPRCVTFTHPGIPFWSFELDPRAPGLVNMLRVCEDCFYFGTCQRIPEQKNQTLVLVQELVDADYIPFHGMHEYTWARQMYDTALPKWPLKAKVAYVGRYGPLIHVQIQLRSAETGTLLMTRTQNFSFASAKTRKLGDLPEWYTSALDGTESAKERLRVERMVKPDITFTQKATVLFTDTDSLQHANYLTYVRFCQRAIRQAATESLRAANSPGKSSGAASTSSGGQSAAWLKKITSDVMRKGVKSARLRYFNECVVGDEVVVHLWEEQDKPFWAFFSVESETPGGASVLRFQMSLEYFTS